MQLSENSQLDRVLEISPGAQKYWERYQESLEPALLSHVGYELVRGGISGPELSVYFEQSGIDTNGVNSIRLYIEFYNTSEADAFHEPRGGGKAAELSREKKQELLDACNSFRKARRENKNQQTLVTASIVTGNEFVLAEGITLGGHVLAPGTVLTCTGLTNFDHDSPKIFVINGDPANGLTCRLPKTIVVKKS